MPISFVAATIYDNFKTGDKENNSILSRGQIITALVDLIAIVAMAIFAAMIAFHVIDTSALTAYILLGATVASTLSNFIAFVIHNYKKFLAKNTIAQPQQSILENNNGKQINELNIAINEKNQALKQIEIEREELILQLNIETKEKGQLAQQLKETNKQIEDLQNTIQILKTDCQKLQEAQAESNEKNKLIEQHGQKYLELLNEKNNLKDELLKVNRRNDHLEKNLKTGSDLLYNDRTVTIPKLKEEIEQSKKDVADKEKELINTRQQMLSAQEKIQQLEQQQAENEDEKIKLNLEITNLKQIVSNKEKELSELHHKSAKELKELETKIDLLQLNVEVKKKITSRMDQLLDQKYKIVENNDNCANEIITQDETIFVTPAQIELMKKDSYFGLYVANSKLDKTISIGVEFFTNLTVYLKHPIFFTNKITSLHSTQLEKQMESLIKNDFEEFFIKLGLSKNKTFTNNENGILEMAMPLALSCLKHADETGNKALIAFWLTALQIHFPLDLVIESFETLLDIKLNEPGRFHEMLFVCLANNLNNTETQKFIEDYAGQGILKINLLELKHLFDSETRQLKPCKKLLSLIDWSSVEVIDTKECNGYSDEAYDEIADIFGKCTSLLCLRHSGQDTLNQIKINNTQILIFDLTGYKDNSNWQRSPVIAGTSPVPCMLRQKPGVLFIRDFLQYEIVFQKYLIKYYDIDINTKDPKEFHYVRTQVLN